MNVYICVYVPVYVPVYLRDISETSQVHLGDISGMFPCILGISQRYLGDVPVYLRDISETSRGCSSVS